MTAIKWGDCNFEFISLPLTRCENIKYCLDEYLAPFRCNCNQFLPEIAIKCSGLSTILGNHRDYFNLTLLALDEADSGYNNLVTILIVKLKA